MEVFSLNLKKSICRPPRGSQIPLRIPKLIKRLSRPNSLTSNVTIKSYTRSITPGSKPNTGRSYSNSSTRSNSSNSSETSLSKVKPFAPNYVPSVTATCWAIYEANSGMIINGKCENIQREVASLTKIMTCYIVLQIIRKADSISMDSIIKVSPNAASTTGTSAKLKAGDELRVEDLLYGLMLPSGNDAAVALGEAFGKVLLPGTNKPLKAFIGEMNRVASELGLTNTYFKNPHGLMIRRNLSTAMDICKLAASALRIPDFRQIVNTTRYITSIKSAEGDIKEVVWENTNQLLSKGFEGVKTGITNNAGPCLCASIRRQDSHLIITVLNSKSMNHRWVEVPKLAEWAFQKLSKVT